MLVIAGNLLRDSKFGMVYRVSVGAILSMLDAVTDIYTISTYYRSENLSGQADALLTMMVLNLVNQLIVEFAQHGKKHNRVKLKELIISLLFIRPAVDAFRVSTNHQDDDDRFDPLMKMMFNKCCELAWESIPGCVLQIYVWLTSRGEAGTYALVSIVVSALTTGFTSAMVSFDLDVDASWR